MQWLEITIATENRTMEAVAEALTFAGFSDLVMEDGEAFTRFLEDNREYWDYIDESLEKELSGLSRIKLYLEEDDREGMTRLENLLNKLRENREKYGVPEMTSKPLANVDWEESWKDNYPPQPVGNRLLVLPCWRAEEDTQGRLPVILDPGLTFGTGAHPSTQMVMEELENRMTAGANCLDLGSGSGILSIAALRLGAKSAIGVDVDPKAEDIARENMEYNKDLSGEFTALTGNVLTDRKLMDRLQNLRYDFVLVNIVADVIIGLAPVLPRFLTEESTLILSGILDARLPDVLAALEAANLEATNIRAKEEWRCVTAKRRTL